MSTLLVCDIGFTCDLDGPGQRLVIYCKGCNLCCPWCALPESIRAEPEVLFYPQRVPDRERLVQACPHGAVIIRAGALCRLTERCQACRGRECLRTGLSAFEGVGREMTITALVERSRRYRIFFGGGGGVTVGGGEPTCQFEPVSALLTELQADRIHTAMETNGTHSKLPDLFPVLDWLFIDLKHPDDAACRAVTGQGNQVVLQNIRARHASGRPLCVRIPLVPGCNADAATLERFGAVLGAIGALTVEILPFHRRGEVKWQALGRALPAGEAEPPTAEQVAAAKAILVRYGLSVV